MGSPDEDRDREFTFANYSNGSVYRGYAANFKVFGRALTAAETAPLPGGSFTGLPTFPRQRFVVFWLMAVMFVTGLIVLVAIWRGLWLEGKTRKALNAR